MERRFAVHAGSHRQALIAICVVAFSAGVASAAPKGKDAKRAFAKGVAAYQKKNYQAAADALEKSFNFEKDVETLFAWAQAERQLGNCQKASELYDKLLEMDMPAENKQAVRDKLEECKAQLATAEPKPPEPKPEVKPEPTPPAPVEPKPPEVKPEPAAPPPPIEHAEPHDTGSGHRSWYRDPVSVTLLGTGVVAAAVGVGLVFSARTLDDQSKHAANYFDAKSLADKASQRGTIGWIATGAGGALIVGGIIYVATRSSGEEHQVTGWLAPGGGGLAIAGGF